MPTAAALVLREGDRDRLAELARRPSVPSGLAKRARIVLLAADGVPNAEIARRAGVSRPTVIGWRDRYRVGGIAALEEQPRSGRPAEIDEALVVLATLADGGRPPQRLGVSCWSARVMAAELGISFASVARIWRRWEIKPHRVAEFTFGTDPELPQEIRDIVGLYLAPPQSAVVVSVQENGQLPAVPAGPAALLAALEMATGELDADARDQEPPRDELLAFVKLVATAHPATGLHVVLDSYGVHRHSQLRRWLARPENGRIAIHLTPARCSWLDMMKVFCGIIAQAAGRDTFPSVSSLAVGISQFIEAHNDLGPSFTWIKDASQLSKH